MQVAKRRRADAVELYNNVLKLHSTSKSIVESLIIIMTLIISWF
jgi:hypothetical protein